MVQEGKVLNITNIDRSDAGTFNCTAYNDFGKPEIQTVYVNVSEHALKKNIDVKQKCTFLILSVL